MREKITAFLTKGILFIVAIPAIVLPLLCIGYIFLKGVGAINIDLFMGNDSPAEQYSMAGGDGIKGEITGTLLLALLSTTMALPLAIGLACWHNLSANKKMRRTVTAILHLLQGLPPLVVGLCALLLLVSWLKWGMSLLAGAVVLAVIVFPIMVIIFIHAIERIPKGQLESAKSLGLGEFDIITRVWLPVAWPHMLTGIFLAMARSMAETAPILFTAVVFSGVDWPSSIFEPVTSLQTHIFFLAQEAVDERSMGVAWGSGLVLVLMTLSLTMVSSFMRRFYK